MPAKPPGFYTIIDFMTMSEFQRNAALAEYKQLVESGAMGLMQFADDPAGTVSTVKKKAKRKKSAYSRALSKELKDVRRKATTKAGKLRKGMTPAKILKKAHRQAKRRLK